jgi:hypothetical protein
MPLDQAGLGMGSAAGGVNVAPGRSRFIAALERRCRRCAEAMMRFDQWHHDNEWSFNILGGSVLLIVCEVIRQLW